MNTGYENSDSAGKAASKAASESKVFSAGTPLADGRSFAGEPASAGQASELANLERLFAGILTGDVGASLDRVRYALRRTQEVAAKVERPRRDRYAKTRTESYTIQVIKRDEITAGISHRQHSGRGWNGKKVFGESKRGGRVIHMGRVRLGQSLEGEVR